MEFGDFDEFFDGVEAVEDSFEDLQESELLNLPLSSSVAKKNYEMAGDIVDEDQISIAAYSHLLNDQVHHFIQEVLL